MSNGKETLGGKFSRDTAARVRGYANERDITKSEALRRLTRSGLEQADRDAVAYALQQSVAMLLIGAVIALCVAIPYGFPEKLLSVAGSLSSAAILAAVVWEMRTRKMRGLRIRRDRSVATDGGERD